MPESLIRDAINFHVPDRLVRLALLQAVKVNVELDDSPELEQLNRGIAVVEEWLRGGMCGVCAEFTYLIRWTRYAWDLARLSNTKRPTEFYYELTLKYAGYRPLVNNIVRCSRQRTAIYSIIPYCYFHRLRYPTDPWWGDVFVDLGLTPSPDFEHGHQVELIAEELILKGEWRQAKHVLELFTK